MSKPLNAVLAHVGLVLVAALLGALTGMAGRVVAVFGLYPVLAALVLSIAAVALCHLARIRPRLSQVTLAILAAIVWLAFDRVADAWLFRFEQAQAVLEQQDVLAEAFLAAEADTALDLVDTGLRAETGHDGLRGALLVQLRSGLVVFRTPGAARVVPMPLTAHVLALAILAALVALVIRRALAGLVGEPACAVCGRYLHRRVLGRVDGAELARLADAWSRGERERPAGVSEGPAVAIIYEDTCPAGHSRRPGLGASRLRRRRFARTPPGPLALLPPET